MIAGNHGIFNGGSVTLDAQANAIRISPVILRTRSGDNVGFGSPGRSISVHFGVSSFGFAASFPSDLEAPVYALYIDSLAGQAHVCYDHGVERDIVVTRTPSDAMTVFATISWPAATTEMSGISVSYADRQETRLIEAGDPIAADELYSSGMDFSDVSFNQPLISMSVLSQVLQGELSSRSGDSFSVVLAKRQDITTTADTVTLGPVEIVTRSIEAGGIKYRLINTKEDFTKTFDDPIATYRGKTIFLYALPETGAPGCDLIQPPGSILIAKGLVRESHTSIADVRFEIASEISQSNAQTGSQQAIYRDSLGTGFVGPVHLSVSEDGLNFVLDPSTVLARGVYCSTPALTVPIGSTADVTHGARYDLLYLEVSQYIAGAPPTDGQSFIPLSGVGYVVAEAQMKLAKNLSSANVCLGLPEALMMDEAVTSKSGAGFSYTPEHGWTFIGEDRDINSYSGMTFGIPLALISRFNALPWSSENLEGGCVVGGQPTRPDGKRNDQVHHDEMWVIAPQVSINGVDLERLMQQSVRALLRGGELHGASFQMSPMVSRFPTHVDLITEYMDSSANRFTWIGKPDGRRMEFSALPHPYRVGEAFDNTGDSGDDNKIFTTNDDADDPDYTTVMVEAPAGAKLTLTADRQPRVLLTDSNGLAVPTKERWSTLDDAKRAQAKIPKNAATRVYGSVEVLQDGYSHLSFHPQKIHQCLINSTLVDHADIGQERKETKQNGNTYEWTIEDNRAEAVRVEIPYVGNGGRTITLSKLKSDGRNVIGVLHAKVVVAGGGTRLVGVRSARLSANSQTVEEVILQEEVQNGTTVYLACALEGRRVRMDAKHAGVLGVSNSLVWETYSAIGTGTTDTYYIPLTGRPLDFPAPIFESGFQYLSTERRGASFDSLLKTGVYVDGYMYPATLKNIGHNQVILQLALTQAEYDALALDEIATANTWQVGADGLYRLKRSVSVNIPMEVSNPLRSSDKLRLVYGYHPTPLFSMSSQVPMEIAHPGRLVASNSSIANNWSHPYAPLAEKLPVVSGPNLLFTSRLIAPGASNVSMVNPSILDVGQDKEPPFAGSEMVLDGRFKFHTGVFDKDSGYVAWLCLVKKERWLRLFCYITEGDTMRIGDARQAFMCAPPGNMVE